jgi:hypothetical protein
VASLQTKTKKRRLTPKQKKAAAERLAVAREKRAKKNPPAYKNIHPDVLALPEDDNWSHKNVKEWIKQWKQIKEMYHSQYKQGDNKALAKRLSAENYVNNMETYLKTSVWLDMFWGPERNNPVTYRCYSPAYYHEGKKKGIMKKNKNTYYTDINLAGVK